MRVIVFGATGGSGRAVLSQGAAAGHEMPAFSRRPFDTAARVITSNALDKATPCADTIGSTG